MTLLSYMFNIVLLQVLQFGGPQLSAALCVAMPEA